jgi:hypothetical protein
MLPVEESRAVTTASMRSPGMPGGRAIVIVEAFETRSVVLPSWKIPSPDGLDGALGFTNRRAERAQAFLKSPLRTLCTSRSGAAEEAFAPASNAAPMRTMHAPAAIDRGRLPNMPAESAHPAQPITPLTRPRYLFGVLERVESSSRAPPSPSRRLRVDRVRGPTIERSGSARKPGEMRRKDLTPIAAARLRSDHARSTHLP